MKVIKVVCEVDGKMVSTFATGKWRKEYAEGVETKPDIGCLFAFSRRDIKDARSSMGSSSANQYWLAEAEVVGRIHDYILSMAYRNWQSFWGSLKLRLRERGADYLLCSSITLTKRLD